MSVQEYLEKHDLSKRVESVINACVKAKPDEPLSFMVSINRICRSFFLRSFLLSFSLDHMRTLLRSPFRGLYFGLHSATTRLVFMHIQRFPRLEVST